jgi:glycosyltransferase involved in cell wall biosynthesis
MVKVYLLVGKSPFYKDLIKYPPKGVEYLPKKTYSYGKDISTYYSSITHLVKRKISSILLEKFKLPRMTYIFRDSSDLIHSNRGILILNKKPWVIDTDYVSYFFGSNILDKAINARLKNLVFRLLASEYCKKIICWSNAAKLSMCNTFKSDKINNKIEILYPAIPAIKIKKRESDQIRLLYVSSSFVKGGEELLTAFKMLLEKYDNIELIFKCDVPETIKTKYNFKEIHYFPYKSQLLPRDKLIKTFHMNSDIFVYPTFGDLFGLGLLDAMVAGLPVVTTRTFAIPEVVEDGKNGFLIDPPYVWYSEKYLPKRSIKVSEASRKKTIKQLVDRVSLLIEDSSLRKRMGKEGRKLVEKGKFSIKTRNSKLKQIYEEAVRS